MNGAYEQIKSQFTRCKELQNEYISLLNRDPVASEIEWIIKMQRNLSKIGSELKVQPVKLPVFEGNVRNYPVCKKNFKKLIAPQIGSDLACSYVLKSCLSDDSAEIVKNLDNTKEIWSRLDIRFGRPSKLVDAVLNELKSVKSIEDASLLKLSDVIEAARRAMTGVGREISNSGCVSLIAQNLPRTAKREWSRFVNSKNF